MTTAENVWKAYMLSVVEKQIRKDIPRTMELREGCLLIKNEKPDNVLEKNEVVKINCIWNDIIQVQPIGVLISRNYTEAQINDLFEIVGHDIMLNDVLEWIKILKGRYAILPNGYFVSIKYEQTERFYVINTFIQWNLPSPYLKDQSEELIKFLYEIVKE